MVTDCLVSLEGAERPSLVLIAISSHLRELGYPDVSINSMLKCGEPSGWFAIRECACRSEFVSLHHRCNLRTCPTCAKLRKSRIFSRFLPFFKRYPVTKSNFFQFLTISPPNYENLDDGFRDIKKVFSKFLRRKYVKERVKAGFYVLETKQNLDDGSWNIHIHAVLYGRFLDYRLRGRCLDCGQNLLKFDRFSKKFFCANRCCNSQNIVRFDDTRLGREWSASSGGVSAHIFGERVRSIHGAVSYLTKYISVDKSVFVDNRSIAQYIVSTHKKKLINAFGLFFKDKLPPHKKSFICRDCDSPVKFYFDIDISLFIKDNYFIPVYNRDVPPPPPLLVVKQKV